MECTESTRARNAGATSRRTMDGAPAGQCCRPSTRSRPCRSMRPRCRVAIRRESGLLVLQDAGRLAGYPVEQVARLPEPAHAVARSQYDHRELLAVGKLEQRCQAIARLANKSGLRALHFELA